MSKFSFPVRTLYAPLHFGNSYELAGRHEIREILKEARWWGFNTYSNFYNQLGIPKDAHSPIYYSHCSPNFRKWERIKLWFREARAAGFDLEYTICANMVFVDQCRENLMARGKGFGHLLCPSIPEARSIMMNNAKDWFADLAQSNIVLNTLTVSAYDFGGCDCEKCRPWIITAGKLAREYYKLAAMYFPDIKLRMIGWFWSESDSQIFTEWVNREKLTDFVSVSLWLKYNKSDPVSMMVPDSCRRNYFIHAGYNDGNSLLNDRYAQWGPVVAPERIPATLESLKASGGEGFMVYSEGDFDELNRAITTGLGSGKFRSVDEILKIYAERYFKVSAMEAQAWAEWLKMWGQPLDVDLVATRKMFDNLAANAENSWRLKQFDVKLKLFELRNKIEQNAVPEKQNELIFQFDRERERLLREVYRVDGDDYFENIVPQPGWLTKWQKEFIHQNKMEHFSAEA